MKTKTLIPGFIDLQVNGYAGIDFSHPDLEMDDVVKVCEILRQQGTAAFLPTIITSSKDIILRNLDLISSAIEQHQLQKYLPGIHLEGPFISAEEGARGAHPLDFVLLPDRQLLSEFIKAAKGKLKILTMAAELKGAEELCQFASENHIIVALGHQLANEQDIAKMIHSGARVATHLGNGLPNIIHRHHNPLFTSMANDALIASIIPDGHHLSESLLKIIVKTKGVQGIIAISDSAPIAGLNPGKYHIFGADVEMLPEGKIVGLGTEYLAGSSSNLLQCMNYLCSFSWFNIEELLQCSLYNPLKLLSLSSDDIEPLDHIYFDEEMNKFELIS